MPGGPVAAIEVTSDPEPGRLALESEIRKLGLSSFALPGLTLRWAVHLTVGAKVQEFRRRPGKLRQLLGDLEAQGASAATDRGYDGDPVVKVMRELKIAFVWRLSTGRGGGVVMGPEAYGGWAWGGPDVDRWQSELLASPQGTNKLEKLDRAKHAGERHLVIVLDSFSQAGIGIPLGLGSRHDPGAADYVMPSFEPPEPLIHMWLLPFPVEDWEGLRWTRGNGWAVLTV